MKKRTWLAVSFVLCGVIILSLVAPWKQNPQVQAKEQKQKTRQVLGRHVDEFTLKDYRGKKHSLSDFKSSKVIVIAVLGTECPLAKLYGPRLATIAEQYQKQSVTFLGINANVQDSMTEVAAYARIHQIKFPILKDLGNKVVDQLGARRTPEIFILDEHRKIRYWGRVDDQYGVGYVREKAEVNYLSNAIDQLLAEKDVTTASTELIGCHIGRVRKPKANAKVTYANQISRLLQKRCVECHRQGEIAPFALSDYKEVVGWAEMIDEVVQEQRMPPWHANPKHGEFQNDRLLTTQEKKMISQWVKDGAPLGDISQLPEPEKYVTGWQLPRKPDVEFFIQNRPFSVAAEGEIQYQWFTIDPKFTEDKWLQAAEIQPGNRAVVHHILAFIRMPDKSKSFSGGGGYLAGYVPGLRATPYPKGMAKFIPAGAHLSFQVHYTPVGSKQLDQSKIGLLFADAKKVTHEVITTQASQHRLNIKPHAENHREEATSNSVPINLQLLSLMPHMHLRGKSFRYEAIYADGKTEILLDVPAYDFNWQTAYHLIKPKNLPPGTKVRGIAHYDNSANNLNNPDPTKRVHWGDQTWEEMMIGYFDIAVPVAISKARREVKTKQKKDPAKKLKRLFKFYDKNKDGKLSKAEFPKKLTKYFDQADRDNSGDLSFEEVEAIIKQLRPS